MNGRIVIEVSKHGEGDEESYHFAIQHPESTTMEQVATVLSIVTRNLRRRAEEQAEEELAQ